MPAADAGDVHIIEGSPRHLALRAISGSGRDGAAALDDALASLSARTTAAALAPLGLPHGFRIDDVVAVTLHAARDGEQLAARLRRVLPPGCTLTVAEAVADAGADATLTIDAVLRERDNLRRREPYR